MATIKLQPSGAVVIKDGKVACACCAQPECCMYPAQALADGLYTYQDLPDTVLFIESNEIFNKLNPPQNSVVGLAYYLGENGGALGSGDENVLIFSDSPTWQRWSGGTIGGPGECLINAFNGPNPTPDSFEDQFANSYTVTPNIGGSASPTVVTRISLCVWRGTDTCGNFVYLSYGSNPNGGQDIMWNVFFRFYTPICVIDGQVDGQKNDDEFENTPVGTYSGTFEDAAFVS